MTRRVMGPPVPRRRPEGIRWLRSDGMPNFRDWVHQYEGDAQKMAHRPVYYTTRTATILQAAEEMSRRWVRALVVMHPSEKRLEGVVSAMDLVDYLGGGEKFKIVLERHGDNIYKALLKEHVESIACMNPTYVTATARLKEILEVMVRRNVGFLPVVLSEETMYTWGVITEHDLVERLIDRVAGLRVEDVMSRHVITAPADARLVDVMRLMVSERVRRVPLVGEKGDLKAIVSAKDVVRLFGSHDIFRVTSSTRLSEAVEQVPVGLIAVTEVVTAKPDEPLDVAAKRMMDRNVGSLVVVDEDNRVVGIVTERDILYGAAAELGVR